MMTRVMVKYVRFWKLLTLHYCACVSLSHEFCNTGN